MLPPWNAAPQHQLRLHRQYFFPDIYRQPKKKKNTKKKKNKKNKSRKKKQKYISCLRQARLGQQRVVAGVASGRSSSSSSSPSSPFPAAAATRRRLVPFNILARHIAAAAATVAHRSWRCDVATFHAAMLPRCTLPSCHMGCVKLIRNGDWPAVEADKREQEEG